MNSEHTPSFNGLGLAPRLLEALDRLKFVTPTPIQHQAIPPALQGQDVVGIAQTGTGKTLAFGLPMLQRLAQVKGRGLVILPTRELALQVDESLQQIGRSLGIRTAVLIGGASMFKQVQSLKKQPHIIIATPGRLVDHLEHNSVRLGDVKILVLDEADRMFDMGFAPQLNTIIGAVPPVDQRQTMLFSATMPPQILNIARKNMRLPVSIEVAQQGTAAEKVEQEVFMVAKQQKTRLLDKLLAETRGSVLVFMRTKHTASRLTKAVRNMGHTAAELHSNRSLAQRRSALDGFKKGAYRVLIATDIAARGIDVRGIELVVNYDLPMNSEDYVHRIGRTGRAGMVGKAVSFAMPDQRHDVRQIERLIRQQLPIKQLPELPPEREHVPSGFDPRDQVAHPHVPNRGGGRGTYGSFRGQRRRHNNERRRGGGGRGGFGGSRRGGR